MKFYQFARSFFRKRVQIRRNFATKCTIRGTRGAKLPVDATFSGRSMVEMLGVLAIIGVLSVGAIAGYSKAMMKYKLNKQTEQIGSILDYVTINLDKFTHDSSISFGILLQKLGAIPVEMIKNPNSSTYYDIFGNAVWPFLNDDTYNIYYGLQISLDKDAHEICMNLYQMAQLRSAGLWQVMFTKDKEDGSTQYGNRTYGDTYCGDNLKCIKDLTLSEIDDLCSTCDSSKSYCNFSILWGRISS